MAVGRESVAEFSFSVEVDSLPKTGRDFKMNASAEECAAVAKRLDLLELKSLSASLHLVRRGGGFISVTGDFDAQLSQACVVTLKPVPAHLHEPISMTFMDAPSPRTGKSRDRSAEELISVEDDDPPEFVTEGRIDLGELVVEQLVLALDPYPRAEDAHFEPQSWSSGCREEAPTSPNPFAALVKLKKTRPQ